MNYVFKIIDDGVGRAYTQELKRQSNVQRTSMGIELTKKRLEQINELYQIKASIEIDDYQPGATYPGTVRDHSNAYSKNCLSMYRAILVDDELAALKILRWELEQHCQDIQVIGQFTDPIAGKAAIQSEAPRYCFSGYGKCPS